LHIYLLGREQGVDFVLYTPTGNRILLTNAPSSSLLSARIAQTRGGRQPLSLLIETRPQAKMPDLHPPPQQILTPSTSGLITGTTLLLDHDLSLTLLLLPQEEQDALLFELNYRQFHTLLPFENTQKTQRALLSQLPTGITLLPAPYPGTGAWPAPELLLRLRPQLTLLPSGTTYPPRVQQLLTSTTQTISIPSQGIVEVICDGEQFHIRTRAYTAEFVR
jgi:hypothetical protein